jgi:hypothetical protein
MKWLDEVNWRHGTAQFVKVLEQGAINMCGCKGVLPRLLSMPGFADCWLKRAAAAMGQQTITVS